MNDAELKAIRNYLSANGVAYYDVQAELIDHFATAVQEIRRKNPQIPFTDALLRAHRRFGGKNGFDKYIRQAYADAAGKTNRLILSSLLNFLKWPYFMFTAGLVAFWWWILSTVKINYSYLILAFIVLYAAIILINEWRLRQVPMFLPRKSNRQLGWVTYLLIYLPNSPFLPWTNGPAAPELWMISFAVLASLTTFIFARIPAISIRETRNIYPQIA
jgi:hypothetical protein